LGSGELGSRDLVSKDQEDHGPKDHTDPGSKDQCSTTLGSKDDLIYPGDEYEFELSNRLSFLVGDSGTDKSTLIELVKDSECHSDVSLDCDLPCAVLSGNSKLWDSQLSLKNVVFIDEYHLFLATDYIPRVRRANCHIVVVCRESHLDYPYDFDNIFKIVSSGACGTYHALELCGDEAFHY
jgi:hypothetical protein